NSCLSSSFPSHLHLQSFPTRRSSDLTTGNTASRPSYRDEELFYILKEEKSWPLIIKKLKRNGKRIGTTTKHLKRIHIRIKKKCMHSICFRIPQEQVSTSAIR